MEGSREGFNQDGSTDGSLRDPRVVLGEGENVVPETSFLVVLHLGKIEIWTRSSHDELASIVEEVEGEIENGTGNGSVVDGHPRFVEMPSPRT